MKAKPILFSGEMIRALLDGRKTQTRRIIAAKHVPFIETLSQRFFDGEWDDRPFPYGKPGDLLWVRETFYPVYAQDPGYNNGQPIEYDYRATYKEGDRLGDYWAKKKWKPGIHMPRAASRITLELTAVRVEQIQKITTGDAWAEGCPHSDVNAIDIWFKPLWNSLNAARGFGWDKNPWVWVIGFKVHKMNIDSYINAKAAA